MSQVTLPLPSRSLSLAPKPFAAPAGFLFTILILGAMAVGLAWWQGPGLLRDWEVSRDPLVLQEWDLVDGECSSRRGLTDCEANVTYSYEGQDYQKYITLAFFDLSSGDHTVDLVVSRNNPDLATLSLGLDMLWNRTIVMAVFLLLFGGGTIAMLISALNAGRGNRAVATPGRLTLVPVEVVEVRKLRGKNAVTYLDNIRAPSKRQLRTFFGKGEEPLIGFDENGKPVGLAVAHEQHKAPVLLDSGLQRIDMTESERQAALAAFDAEQQQRGMARAANPQAQAKRGPNILRGLAAGLGVIVLAVVGFFGFWLYYVTTAPDAFDSIGIEINNIMPEPLNTWGCEQLYKRFGDDRAPYGCVADDYRSWKVAQPEGKVKS